jgi:crossover junction endodeoxyribonuclease RuvC
MRIIGLDLSLTATGIAIIDDGVTSVSTVTSKGAKTATLEERVHRLDDIERRILHEIGIEPADLIVVEQPAFSRTTGHHHDRSGLWWRIVSAADFGIGPVAEVAPTTLKKYATGKGNASKDAVLAATVRRFSTIAVANNNEADALVLAAMGADHLSHPIAAMPAAHRVALEAVRWP